jgi:hypothetical protein
MKGLARLAGFEPATYGLEVRCSIQLSYRRVVFSQTVEHELLLRFINTKIR